MNAFSNKGEELQMVKVIKSGKSQEEVSANDLKVSQIVSEALHDVEARGDQAVRELSEKFDKWSPESFRLSSKQIEEMVAQVPSEVIEDIKFAQKIFGNLQKHSSHLFRM